MVYQMCKSTGQSKSYIEDNYTKEEIIIWFQFGIYEDYVTRNSYRKE